MSFKRRPLRSGPSPTGPTSTRRAGGGSAMGSHRPGQAPSMASGAGPSLTSSSSSLAAVAQSWPGTMISAHGGSQVLVSTGVSSLDNFLGGGLPVGSVTLVKEDKLSGYSRLLRNYFVAQGIASSQFVCYTSADENDPASSLRQLMAVVGQDSSSAADLAAQQQQQQQQQSAPSAGDSSRRLRPSVRSGMGSTTGSNDERMKIAWRYQNMPNLASGAGSGNSAIHSTGNDSPYTSIFDLTKTIPKESIDKALETQIAVINARTWASDFLKENDRPANAAYQTSASDKSNAVDKEGASPAKEPDTRESKIQLIMKQRPYVRLLEHLSQVLTEFKLTSNPKGVLRICINSLASPSWIIGDQSDQQGSVELFVFLHSLKMMIRDCAAVCMITMPAHLYGDQYPVLVNPTITQVQHCCDCVIELESFSGSARTMNKQYEKLYNGLLHILKLPRIGMIQAISLLQRPSSGHVELSSLGFNVRRKRFLVETIYLPPEDEDDDIILKVSNGETGDFDHQSHGAKSSHSSHKHGPGCSHSHGDKSKDDSSHNSGGIEIAFENSDSNSESEDSDDSTDSDDESVGFEHVGAVTFGDVEEVATDDEDDEDDEDGDDNDEDYENAEELALNEEAYLQQRNAEFRQSQRAKLSSQSLDF